MDAAKRRVGCLPTLDARVRGKVNPCTREEVEFILSASAIVDPKFLVILKFLFETGARKSGAINLV